MSFPPNQFQLRQKGARPYYVYADPFGCTCAYVGGVAAMNEYRASYGAFPAHAPSAGAFTNAVQNMINSMDNDEASAQFNNDVFGPNFKLTAHSPNLSSTVSGWARNQAELWMRNQGWMNERNLISRAVPACSTRSTRSSKASSLPVCAGSAADQIRSGDQHEDCHGARPHRARPRNSATSSHFQVNLEANCVTNIRPADLSQCVTRRPWASSTRFAAEFDQYRPRRWCANA